jgi:hypothetical protein
MWGNPRARYVGILRVISDLRTRQPRDGQMKCGNQPANISMINCRQSLSRVAFPFRCEIPVSKPSTSRPKRGSASFMLAHVGTLFSLPSNDPNFTIDVPEQEKFLRDFWYLCWACPVIGRPSISWGRALLRLAELRPCRVCPRDLDEVSRNCALHTPPCSYGIRWARLRVCGTQSQSSRSGDEDEDYTNWI